MGKNSFLKMCKFGELSSLSLLYNSAIRTRIFAPYLLRPRFKYDFELDMPHGIGMSLKLR